MGHLACVRCSLSKWLKQGLISDRYELIITSLSFLSQGQLDWSSAFSLHLSLDQMGSDVQWRSPSDKPLCLYGHFPAHFFLYYGDVVVFQDASTSSSSPCLVLPEALLRHFLLGAIFLIHPWSFLLHHVTDTHWSIPSLFAMIIGSQDAALWVESSRHCKDFRVGTCLTLWGLTLHHHHRLCHDDRWPLGYPGTCICPACLLLCLQIASPLPSTFPVLPLPSHTFPDMSGSLTLGSATPWYMPHLKGACAVAFGLAPRCNDTRFSLVPETPLGHKLAWSQSFPSVSIISIGL